MPKETNRCAIEPGDWGIYVGGPVRGADDFHEEAVKRLAAAIPHKGRRLHIVNPRWEPRPRHDWLPLGRQEEWTRQHQKAIFRLGAHGVAIFYAERYDADAPIPLWRNGLTYGSTLDTEFTDLAHAQVIAGKGAAPVVLGVELNQPLGNLQPLFLTATEFGYPIESGISATCSAAAALLIKQAAQPRV
jgi:hypothetical protein